MVTLFYTRSACFIFCGTNSPEETGHFTGFQDTYMKVLLGCCYYTWSGRMYVENSSRHPGLATVTPYMLCVGHPVDMFDPLVKSGLCWKHCSWGLGDRVLTLQPEHLDSFLIRAPAALLCVPDWRFISLGNKPFVLFKNFHPLQFSILHPLQFSILQGICLWEEVFVFTKWIFMTYFLHDDRPYIYICTHQK